MILPIAIAVVVIVAAGGASYWQIRKKANHSNRKTGPKSGEAAEDTQNKASEQPAASAASTRPAHQNVKPSPKIKELSSLPESAKNRLVNAVWYRCENPYCKHTNFLEVHQIVSEIEGGTNALDNLIVLCSDCHRLADNHEIPLNVMKSWIIQKKDRFRENPDWQYK